MKYLIPVVLLVSVVLIAGCTGGNGGAGGGTYDCGSDEACFKAKLANCEPAKVVVTNSETSDVGTMSTTISSEVKSGTVDACTFYMKVDDITFPSGLSSDQLTLYEGLLGWMEGKDMTCTMPVSQLSGKETSTSVADTDACTGTLIDAIEDFSAQ